MRTQSTKRLLSQGITIVELLIASAVGVLVMSFAVYFFSGSRGQLRSSELELDNLVTLRQLNASVVRHIRSIRPFRPNDSSLVYPIDLYGVQPLPGVNLQRVIDVSLRHDGPGFSREKDLNPFIFNVQSRVDNNTGVSSWASNVSSDSFFEFPETIRGMQEAQAMMMATALNDLTVEWGTEEKANVSEFIFWNGYQKMRYRHFKQTSKGTPLFFINLDVVDSKSEWINVKTFGGIEDEPWITDFRFNSFGDFRCIYYENGAEWHGFDGLAFQISILVESPKHLRDAHGAKSYSLNYRLQSNEQMRNLAALSYDDIGLY